jgi:hypothetical protein
MYNINIKNSFVTALKYIEHLIIRKPISSSGNMNSLRISSISIIWTSKCLERKINLGKNVEFKSFKRSPGEPQNAEFCTVYPRASGGLGRHKISDHLGGGVFKSAFFIRMQNQV